ncbi:ABATE domain-containing protein, partial [Singulisphaera rosea]
MDRPAVRTSDRPHDLDFIGDHLAIDFINTVRVVDGEVSDTLRSDRDVEIWLGLASAPVASRHSRWEDGSLLASTRRLRKATL